MRMYVKVMAAVIACILLSGEALSAFATAPATENLSWFKKKKKKNSEEERVKSDYEKLVEGSSVKKGMFAVYQKKNDYYFEIPTSLLGRDLLIVNKLQRVPAELNDAGVNRGVNYENQMVSMEWDKATGKLMFRQQRPLPLAPQTDAIFRSVKDNFISPLIAAFKIEAVNQDSTALVIKINDIYDGTETSINNVFTNINLGTSAIKNLSRILSVKSFPNNVVATSELTTKVTEGTTSVYVTVEVSSSILLLPETPMMGRFDNQKIGYFTNPLLSFSDAQQRTDKKQFITRWRMEPKPEDRKAAMRDIVDFIYDDYRQVLLAPHKRMDIIVGSLLMTGAASVKNKDDNAGGIDLLNIDLPFKFIKPDTEDKDYFVTYLQQKLNELKSIYGTFPKMIMSRGTFIKNIIGSSEFGDKFKMQLTGNEMYMSTGLITSQLASTIFTGIGLPAIEIKEDYVVDQTGKNIPIYADGRISLLPQDKIGYMRFHTPYEAVDGVPGRNYTQADGDMLISGYKDGNGRYLEYTAEWIPQIANPNLIVNFDLSEMNA